jgi:hypothetical protein
VIADPDRLRQLDLAVLAGRGKCPVINAGRRGGGASRCGRRDPPARCQ